MIVQNFSKNSIQTEVVSTQIYLIVIPDYKINYAKINTRLRCRQLFTFI